MKVFQTFDGHTRMVLQIVVTPKMFYTSSTDLSVRSWVYEFEESVKVFKGHQHSVGAIQVIGNTCKLGQVDQARLLQRTSVRQRQVLCPN